MSYRHAIRLAALAGALGLQACASTTPYLDSRFGYAVNAAKAQQTLDPDAGRNRDPVAGLGGVPAKESIDRYHDTFKAPPPTFEVLMGTVSGGANGER